MGVGHILWHSRSRCVFVLLAGFVADSRLFLHCIAKFTSVVELFDNRHIRLSYLADHHGLFWHL